MVSARIETDGGSAAKSCAAWPGADLLARTPWTQNWGLDGDEGGRPLPGDDLIPRPMWSLTRSVTVRAPASAVWSFLIRAGWWPRGSFRVARIVPGRALVLHSARHSFTGQPIDVNADSSDSYNRVDFTWALVLDRVDDGTTRLTVRQRVSRAANPLATMLVYRSLDPADSLMSRATLLDFRRRAEEFASGIRPGLA